MSKATDKKRTPLETALEARMMKELDSFDATTTVLTKGGEAVHVALYPGETRVKCLEVVSEYVAKTRGGSGPEWGKALTGGRTDG